MNFIQPLSGTMSFHGALTRITMRLFQVYLSFGFIQWTILGFFGLAGNGLHRVALVQTIQKGGGIDFIPMLSFSGQLIGGVFALLTGAFNSIGNMSKGLEAPLDGIIIFDGVFIRGKLLSGTLLFASTFTKAVTYLLSTTLTCAGAMVKFIHRLWVNLLSFGFTQWPMLGTFDLGGGGMHRLTLVKVIRKGTRGFGSILRFGFTRWPVLANYSLAGGGIPGIVLSKMVSRPYTASLVSFGVAFKKNTMSPLVGVITMTGAITKFITPIMGRLYQMTGIAKLFKSTKLPVLVVSQDTVLKNLADPVITFDDPDPALADLPDWQFDLDPGPIDTIQAAPEGYNLLD